MPTQITPAHTLTPFPSLILSLLLAWHRWNPCRPAVQLTMATTHTTTQTRHVCRRTPSSCCGVEGGMPANCACVCVCVPHPAASTTLHPVRVGAHICVLIFLEAHGCPPPLLLFSPPHHVEERESKGEGSRAVMQSRHGQAWAGSGMSITNLAVRWHVMCCWMLMQSTRSTTLVRHLSHLDILSISTSSTAFPFLSSLRCDTTTKKVSAPPCSRASAHAMAAMGDGVVGVGRGSNRRREEKRRGSTISHSLTHVPLAACVYRCGMQVEEDMGCWWW